MTRAERLLAPRWRSAAVVCVLVALAGAVIIIWARIDAEARRADQLAAEADLRGTAVSTLAGDVVALRQQLQAAGKTPVVQDPSKTVSNLPDRTTVPVPIPGPPGSSGTPGADGKNGSNGTNGKAGQPGADSTVPGPIGPTGPAGPTGPTGPGGPAGPSGPPGADGKDGSNGTNGQTCPDGYSLQAPSYDPDALVCRRNGAPQPTPTPTPSSTGVLGLAADRRWLWNL